MRFTGAMPCTLLALPASLLTFFFMLNLGWGIFSGEFIISEFFMVKVC